MSPSERLTRSTSITVLTSTARSTSPRLRSGGRLSLMISSEISGWSRRSCARPCVNSAVSACGTDRRTRAHSALTAARAADTARSTSRTSGAIRWPSGVNVRPSGPRRTSGAPNARSSTDRRRPIVVCWTPSERAAPASVFCCAARRKKRRSSQLKSSTAATSRFYGSRRLGVRPQCVIAARRVGANPLVPIQLQKSRASRARPRIRSCC